MKTEAIHELTLAEIARLTAEFSQRRRSYTEELATLFAAAGAGQPEAQPATQRGRGRPRPRARNAQRARPGRAKAPAVVSRKAELEIEVEAVDRVLEVLSTKELIARAAEAAERLLEGMGQAGSAPRIRSAM